MSWSLSVSPTPREDFAAAVDAAEAGGQDLALPGVADAIEAARLALKHLADQVKRPTIGGSASGHSLQADEGPNWSDSVSVNVYGVAQEVPS